MKRDFSCLFLILMSAGCQNMSFPEANKPIFYAPSDFTHLIMSDTPYYQDGPQQGRPEDGFFVAGTKLKFIKNSGSYSLVESPDGIKAYISQDAMKKL